MPSTHRGKGAGEGASVQRTRPPNLDTARTTCPHPHPSPPAAVPPSPLQGEGLAHTQTSLWYSGQVHFFHFKPEPQGQGSLRPIFFSACIGMGF